ncbi:MAG: hypothetical protein JNL75_01795, partial [Chitinophagales bacterium]|nr:hypothetical protein [Chitinophagales bacterium]
MILSQTTLGELYQSLSTEEVKGLDLYLQKNTVGKNNMLYQLHKLMVDVKHQAMLAKLDTDYLKAELFGGDTKSVSKLTTYNNLLINHIKEFVILSKVRKKNVYTEILWGEVLIENRLKRNLLLKLTNFKKEIEDNDYPLMKLFFHQREKFFYEHLILTKKNYENLIISQFDQIKSFEEYYEYYSLELFISLFSFLNQANKVYLLDRSEINNKLIQGKKSSNVSIQILALILDIQLNIDQSSYFLLRNLLYDNFETLSINIKTQIIPVLVNYINNSVHKGNELNEHENYMLFMYFDKNNVMHSKGVFSLVRLISYIILELRYGTIEKAEQLLEESLKVISPAQKDSFQYLIESRIAFAKKDFKLSLRKISIINPSDSIYYFPQYKIMLIKNYIMLADIDRLMAERENFYKYLNNQKNIQEDEKRRHKLFIKYTEYLTNARYEHLTDYMKRRIENALLQTSPY